MGESLSSDSFEKSHLGCTTAMVLTEIEILGFRGFKNRGVLNFAIPNGQNGSGLTIITGPNNAGKSSILECLKARAGHQSPSFTDVARNADVQEVEITYTVGDKKELIKSVRKGSSETIREGIDNTFSIFVLPSRRAFNPYFARNEYSRVQYQNITNFSAQRSSTLSNFEARLFTIERDPDQFNEMLYEVLGFKPNWSIDKSGQDQHYLKFFNGNHSHTSDGMGEGIVSIFAIVDALYDSQAGSVIAIDEPELSLHPSLQKRLALLIKRLAKDRQIIISTHSPYFVNLENLITGGHLARITTTEKGTEIHQISESAKMSISKLAKGNLNNPHVLGLDARELFFQEDKIVLTEGQEDVIFYPQIAEQVGVTIDGNLLGWGAGGASNIKHLCLILESLGFKKVAGLLDNDKSSERDELKKQFPAYYFACIQAKDIRTKPARIAVPEVQGLLDDKRNLKPEFYDGVKNLLQALNDHMNA
jgi:predicted ATP-dependent endonuclease of OLD family